MLKVALGAGAALLTVVAALGAVQLATNDGEADSNGVASAALRPAGEWATDSIWYDGLVEKAVYDAQKVIYDHPRSFEAVFLTNKEAHDTQTWTKSAGGSENTVEVWKHNQIEVVPTPNYDYKFVTTSHLTVDGLGLTRLDAGSQEWCGTSFHQYLRQAENGNEWDYIALSYMPEEGLRRASVAESEGERQTIPFNALPLALRGYDFDTRADLSFSLLPDQKSNRFVPYEPVDAVVTFAGETDAGYELVLSAAGEEVGTFEFARDRQHVMLRYEGVNGDRYTLKSLDRVNYWTRDE